MGLRWVKVCDLWWFGMFQSDSWETPWQGFHLGPNWFPMPRQRGYNLRPHNPTSRKPLSVPLTAQFESSFEITECARSCNCRLKPKPDFCQTHSASEKTFAVTGGHLGSDLSSKAINYQFEHVSFFFCCWNYIRHILAL